MVNNDFGAYCYSLTTSQLEAVIAKEWEASRGDPARLPDYHAAVREGARRGWTVKRDRRVS